MKSKKKLLLLGVGAMGALAMGVGATSTFAWYQAQSNVGITKGTTAHGALSTVASQLDVQNYTVNFDIVPTTASIQLSHVVTAAEASAGLANLNAASLTAGDLVYGGVYNSAVKLAKAESTTGLITTYTVSASWASAPTDPAEIEYIKGKHFTATMTAGDNAEFVANAVSGLTPSATATVVFTITYSAGTWTFTPAAPSIVGIHVEPANVSTTTLDDGTVGSVSVTEVSTLAA